MKVPLQLGCTLSRHKRIGIDAVVNARGDQQWRNSDSIEEIEMQRDARAIRDRLNRRVRFYQFGSRHFRRRQGQLAHLLSNYND